MGICSSCDSLSLCIKCPICNNNLCNECYNITKYIYGTFKFNGNLIIKSCHMCTEMDIGKFLKKNNMEQCHYCQEYVNENEITLFFNGICITCLTVWQINYDNE